MKRRFPLVLLLATWSSGAGAEPLGGLVSQWSGDGDARDSAGSNHATLVGGTTFAPGLFGQAFSFDGLDDFVNIPDSTSLDSIRTGVTVSAWVNPQMSSTPGSYIFGRRDPLVSEGYSLNYFFGSNELLVSARTTSSLAPSGSFFITESGVVPSGQWSHVALTIDTGTGALKVFVNGDEQRLTNTEGGTQLTGELSDVDQFYIGRRQSAATPEGVDAAGYFAGLIDEIQLFNRALWTFATEFGL